MGLVGAVLLGRLYGCTAEEALLRVQVSLPYHTSSYDTRIYIHTVSILDHGLACSLTRRPFLVGRNVGHLCQSRKHA